jgi:uncharacterized protein (TIGR00369 family)
MSRIAAIAAAARDTQQPALLLEAVPFAAVLGLRVSVRPDGGLLVTMPFSPHLVGNPGVPALHGGTLGSLLETVAVLMVLWEVDPTPSTRVITLTTDYLRPALLEDTFATGEFLRVGRRVVAVEVRVWQGEDRLVASGRAHIQIG